MSGNSSLSDLPVNSPDSIARAPVLLSTPSPLKVIASTNSAGLKFQ